MIFENDLHKVKYKEYLLSMPDKDCYHMALAYIMGLLDDMGDQHGIRLYDKDKDCIRPETLHEAWQTGASVKATRLAFNLFTDETMWSDPEDIAKLSPAEIFSNAQWRPYFIEAVRIRFEDAV